METNDNFEKKKCKDKDVTDTVKDSNMDFFDTVKGGAERVYETASETAGDVFDEIKEQGARLDEKERLIKSIPNSYLALAGVLLLAYAILK